MGFVVILWYKLKQTSEEKKPVIKTVAMVAAEEGKLAILKSLVRAKADLNFDVRKKGRREGREGREGRD